MLLSTGDRSSRKQTRLAVLFNRSDRRQIFSLPSCDKSSWRILTAAGAKKANGQVTVASRSVAFCLEI
jgi:glycogen operon protein